MLLTDGAGTVSWGAQPVAGLPSQTSNGGKLLTTDGTNASWSNAVTVSGSNATVTGTLTVNGASTFNNTVTISTNVGFIGKSGSGTGGNWRYISDDGTSRWLSGILGSPSETAFDIYDIVNGRSLLTLTAAGVVKVPQTTASTSTSSGALVVGNGTSGGLGVGGAIYAGGILKTTVADAAYNARFFGATGGMRVRGYTDATYGTVVDSLNTAESAYQPLTIAASDLRLNDLTNGTIVTGTGTFTIGGAVIANASSNAFRISNSQTPASAAATGTAGTIAWDSSYIYVCTGTNQWKRAAISTW
jgi:hypothetical protein